MKNQAEFTRQSLIHQKMGFNQMRNSIYWLQRYMLKNDLTNDQIQERLINMGKNIGATFIKEIVDIDKNILDLIKEYYFLTVRSKIKIENSENIYIVKDNNSALDKYQYDDVSISGDYIIVATIAEMLERSGFLVKSFEVSKCRSRGDSYSEHTFEISRKERSNE